MKKKRFKDFEVDVFGHKWMVKFTSELNPALAGECDYAKKTLWIDDTKDKHTTIVTIIHELFHAYIRRSGLYSANLSHDLEEIIADQFATVIADNFDFNL